MLVKDLNHIRKGSYFRPRRLNNCWQLTQRNPLQRQMMQREKIPP